MSFDMEKNFLCSSLSNSRFEGSPKFNLFSLMIFRELSSQSIQQSLQPRAGAGPDSSDFPITLLQREQVALDIARLSTSALLYMGGSHSIQSHLIKLT